MQPFQSVFQITIVFVAYLVLAGDPPAFGQQGDGSAALPEYLNAREGVKYVGSQACVECHQDQHASYLKTTHSVATTRTDPNAEAPSGSFIQKVTGIEYEVERSGGKLIQREIIRSDKGDAIAETEQPIVYTVGSGEHGKSYLYEAGPFLGQSPITWFQETGTWGMSPGFDRPFHKSFHRTIGTDCVFCHVGSIDRLKHNPYRFKILETTIGCERCHGPGELHVAKYREAPNSSGADLTIVNPANLSRERAEAVCQQCHLQGISKADVTGKDSWDFRPSQLLTDYRVDYQLGLGGQRMKIVGHVEQLHASECYKQTETLTCTTCHDPHNPIPKAERVEYHRSVCLDCHENGECGEPLDKRLEVANNSCFECHMPKRDTNVTHAAFHQHRIAVHRSQDSEPEPTGELIPVISALQLSQRERDRCEAIAKFTLLQEAPGNPNYQPFGMQATETLIRLKQTGPVDARIDSQLALLADLQGQKGIAENLAREALAKQVLPTMARIEATSLLGQLEFQRGNAKEGAELYRLLRNYHRDARDMFYLGLCENNIGNVAAAIDALKDSLKIDPTQVGPHTALRAIYKARGEEKLSEEQAKLQQQLTELAERWEAARNP